MYIFHIYIVLKNTQTSDLNVPHVQIGQRVRVPTYSQVHARALTHTHSAGLGSLSLMVEQ